MKKIKLTRIVIYTETETTKEELNELLEKIKKLTNSDDINFQYTEL